MRARCEAQGVDPDIIPPPLYTTDNAEDAASLASDSVGDLDETTKKTHNAEVRWRACVIHSEQLRDAVAGNLYSEEVVEQLLRELEPVKERAQQRCEELGIELPSEAEVLGLDESGHTTCKTKKGVNHASI